MKRDPYCWVLHDHYMGEDKQGNPKRQLRITYHANFEQIAYTILNRMAGDCETLEEMITLYKSAELIITTQLEEHIEPRSKS